MKIMLDKSPEAISKQSDKFGEYFWQLRTPLTRFALSGRPYGLDNGCFSEFKRKTWERLLADAKDTDYQKPVFVCMPDIVGDAARTLELFDQFAHLANGLPRALVLQDGIGNHRIEWRMVSAVFVGGSDAFKTSPEALNAAKAAKMLGKWVHVGRVNTPARVRNWLGLADSIDGSGISRYDHMLRDVLMMIRNEQPQQELAIAEDEAMKNG